jgi:hypothetical protein
MGRPAAACLPQRSRWNAAIRAYLQELLREIELVFIDAIACHEQPASGTFAQHMQAVAREKSSRSSASTRVLLVVDALESAVGSDPEPIIEHGFCGDPGAA